MNTIKDRHILIIIVLFVFGFLSLTRTLTSGYHFVDDHEIIRIKHDLGQASAGKVTGAWIKEDINTTARFRPLYFVFRVIETKLFRSDFFIFSLYNGLLWCLTLILFYLGMKNLSFRIIESVIFLIITFIGPQMEIWWRLGPQESLGMTFLAFSFYFMSLNIINKHYHLSNILFVVFLIAASLVKESFILIIPAILLFKVWYEIKNSTESFSVTLIKNSILVIPLLIAAGELVFIKYNVGLINSGLSNDPGMVIKSVFQTSLKFTNAFLNLIICGVILLVFSKIIGRRINRPELLSVIFLALILIPNFVLYSGGVMVHRYLFPSAVAIGYFVIANIRGSDQDPSWFRRTVYSLIIVSQTPLLVHSVNDAARFSRDGKEINKLFAGISKNLSKGMPALVVINPVESYEKSVSLKYYLNYEFNVELYGQFIVDPGKEEESGAYVEGLKSYFSERLFEDLKMKPDLIIFLNKNLKDKFFQTSDFGIDDFSVIDLGNSSYSLLKSAGS